MSQMTKEEFLASCTRLYGEKFTIPAAAALGVDTSTLRRWSSGQINVPGPVAAALRCFESKGKKR